MKWLRDPRCSPEGTRRVRELWGVARRVSCTVSHFSVEHGTALETPYWARASSCEDLGTTWFFSSCRGILEYHGDFRLPLVLAPGSPNFHSICKGKLGVTLESLQGQRDLI